MSISFSRYASNAGGGTGAGGFIPTVTASSGPADEALLNELYASWMAMEIHGRAPTAVAALDLVWDYLRSYTSVKDLSRWTPAKSMVLARWLKAVRHSKRSRAVLQMLEQKWLSVPAPIRSDVEQEYVRLSSDESTNRVAESERMKLGWLKLLPPGAALTEPAFWDACRIVYADIQLWERYLQAVHHADLLAPVADRVTAASEADPEYLRVQRMVTLYTDLHSSAAVALTTTADELDAARVTATSEDTVESDRNVAIASVARLLVALETKTAEEKKHYDNMLEWRSRAATWMRNRLDTVTAGSAGPAVRSAVDLRAPRRRLVEPPQKFSGRSESIALALQHVTAMERALASNGRVADDEKILDFGASLVKPAADWYDTFLLTAQAQLRGSYLMMIVAFLHRYGSPDPHDDLTQQYEGSRHADETYEMYERRLRRYGILLDKSEEDMTRQCFKALTPAEVRSLYAAQIYQGKTNVGAVMQHLRELERLEERLAQTEHASSQAVKAAVLKGAGGRSVQQAMLLDENGEPIEVDGEPVMILRDEIRCRTCNEVGHHFLECKLTQCHRCQRQGHVIANCQHESAPCEKCKRFGHASSMCNGENPTARTRYSKKNGAGAGAGARSGRQRDGVKRDDSGLSNEAAVVEHLARLQFPTEVAKKEATTDLMKVTAGMSYAEAKKKLGSTMGWAKSLLSSGGATAAASQDFRQGQ